MAGCTDETACNFDASADYLDASQCDYTTCAGCTDAEACNYDATATLDNGSCEYPELSFLDCDGNCLNDADGDSVCNELEIADVQILRRIHTCLKRRRMTVLAVLWLYGFKCL